MSSESVSFCRHCDQRIVLVNYAIGPTWEHQAAEVSFADGRHTFCRRTLAEPVESPDQPLEGLWNAF